MSQIQAPFLLPADITETSIISIQTHNKHAGQKITKWINNSCLTVLIQNVNTETLEEDVILEKLLQDYTNAPYLCQVTRGDVPSLVFL